MIDLQAAYVRMDALLAERGLSEHAYLVRIDAWNHRRGGPAIHFLLSVVDRNTSACKHAEAAKLDDALEALCTALDADPLLSRPPVDLGEASAVRLPGDA